MKAAVGLRDWSIYEVHVCNRKDCVGYAWPYLPRKEWADHAGDVCPECEKQPRFKPVGVSGRLRPVACYIDLRVEEVIKEDFFKDGYWVSAWQRRSREQYPGLWRGSPEYQRMQQKFDKLSTPGPPRLPGFDDAGTSHWELMADAAQPYKSVQHSTDLIAVRNVDVDPLEKNKDHNYRVVIIMPGPRAAPNPNPYFFRTLKMLRKYGLRTRGLPMPCDVHAPGSASQQLLQQASAHAQHQPQPRLRIALTGVCSVGSCCRRGEAAVITSLCKQFV